MPATAGGDFAGLPIKSAIAEVEIDPNKPDTFASKLKGVKLKCGYDFIKWFSALKTQVDARPQRLAHVSLTGQVAAIPLTPLPIGSLTKGIWRISTTLRVTTPATVNSNVQLTLTWTDRTVVQTQVGTNLVGNTTTTREQTTVIIRIDDSSPISYSTTYGSVGATAMAHELDIVAELLAAD